MAASVLAKIVARVSWILAAHNGTFGDTLSDDRFILEELRRATIETESELVRAICESHHPMRSQFLAWSSSLADGDTLPARIGQVEAVRIEPYSAAGTYLKGESTSRENVKLWRANVANIFDTVAHDQNGSNLAGYFNITGETITFTGNAAQVKVCSYVPDYTTPALVIDDKFDGALVAGTVMRLNKIGVPQDLIQTYGSIYNAALFSIRQGLATMPEISPAQGVE